MNVAARRELLAATQDLVKTNKPDAEHYNRVLAALAAVVTDDIGVPLQAVLVAGKRPTAPNGETR